LFTSAVRWKPAVAAIGCSHGNGCAFSIDIHAADARNAGESERCLYAITAWREAPFFSARERAALAWTEALTLIARATRRMPITLP